jgi:signal transduction histidine kinase
MKLLEVAKVTLQTEMDLIIAHKRSMKLAELAGLSLSAQTTFATAVSEVSRNTIEHGKNGCLVLCFSTAVNSKFIVARIIDEEQTPRENEGLEYAKRLVNKYNITTSGNETAIELYYSAPQFKADTKQLDDWKQMFRNAPPVSPYEEIKLKNEQLQELSEKLQKSEELKEAQEKLKEYQATLEQNIADLNRSNLELQQFAYVASHDLQEPIRKISYYSDYVINRYAVLLDDKGKEYLNAMALASSRMRGLVHDLLAFSQVEKKTVELKKVNLDDVLKDVLHDIDVMIKEKNAHVQVEPLPAVQADEGMMRQLFENLITNSIKYSKEDQPPLIRISSSRNNGGLEISVADNGIGFDEKYLPQMFMLFQRLHSVEKYKGTGLGLAICQKIVRLHNGSIKAKSRENEGATFIVSLPYNNGNE